VSASGSGVDGYSLSGTTSYSGNTTAASITVNCSVQVAFVGDSSTYTGTSSTSFTVVVCSGAASSVMLGTTESDGIVTTDWQLALNATPSGDDSYVVGSASGTGTGSDVPSEDAFDCNGDSNSGTENDPSIQDLGHTSYGNYIVETWSITSWSLDTSPCQQCDIYPNGVTINGAFASSASTSLGATCGPL
jgi:hypothetical protein